MKKFIFALLFLMLAACAKPGSDGQPSPSLVPSVPRSYKVLVNMTSPAPVYFTIDLICDFGLSTERRYGTPSMNVDSIVGQPIAKTYECGNALNATAKITNNGSYNLVYAVYVDGVLKVTDTELLPGKSFNFQQGL